MRESRAVLDKLNEIPGFLSFVGVATPETVNDVQQLSQSGAPLFGSAGSYGFLVILSTLSWGLGYFGIPQVLLRFIASRKILKLKARRIATIWCAISLVVAVAIGLIGRAAFPAEHLMASDAERIFITLSTKLLPPVLAGLVMSGILAATISSSDSYL